VFGTVLGAISGLVVGSFVATLVLRWPSGRSVLSGRSACDGCGRTLRPLELVPLFSAALQRGRCRTCASPIDPLHWQVEAGCAVIGGAVLGLWPGVEGVGWALLGWLLLTIAILDWRHFWLPDALTLPLAFAGLTLGQWMTDVTLSDRIIGALCGYGILLAVAIGYHRLRGREGLGLGDAKLLGGLAAWFGWKALPFIVLFASGSALLVVGANALRSNAVHAGTRVPLGTYLCLAAIPGWVLSVTMLGI
jgi:leader peptidase (prepilin peptidase)/N-methyltransferase